MLNALTIDLEDWYHGLTCTMRTPERWPTFTHRADEASARLLDLLAAAGVRATFFVLGDLARQSPALLRRIAEAGHELGSHGYSHRPIHSLTPDLFRQELDRTADLVAQATGIAVRGFRAPQFSIDPRCLWAFQVLAEAGYQYDSSVFPVRTLLYGYRGANRLPYRPLADANLVEYPLATARLAGVTLPVAGGVYNRWLPYRFVRWGVRQLNRQGVAAVLYLHPWELDNEQPRVAVSPRERLTHYGRRLPLEGKLRHLFRDFALAPLGEVHRRFLAHNQARSMSSSQVGTNTHRLGQRADSFGGAAGDR